MKHQNLLGSFGLLAMAIVLGYLIGLGVNTWTREVQAQDKLQEAEKVVKLAYSRKPQLKISNLKTGQKAREFDESFVEAEDWLKNLSFQLENVSGKSIVHLVVNINFPETKATGSMMSYGITFGQRPGSKIRHKPEPMLLKPNEILEVSLNNEYEKIVKFINSRQSIGSIREAQLEIDFIVFEDKIAWSSGSFMRQDPSNPNRYIPLETNLPH